jgi:phosphatidylserine/phosphatidylglycerophosphate/cardiolipin synthase-like enzyme
MMKRSIFMNLLMASLLTSSLAFASQSVVAVSGPADIEQSVDNAIKSLNGKSKLAAEKTPEFREKLLAYAKSLKMKNDVGLSKVLRILMTSSTQFLFCSDSDWECLEKAPIIPPNSAARQEAASGLGDPVLISEPLNMEYFFTKRWFQIELGLPQNEKTVAEIFAEKIKKFAVDGLYMAIYGIDEADGSMKPVFDAIASKVHSGIETQAVVDVTSEAAPNSFLRAYDIYFDEDGQIKVRKYTYGDLNFSYVKPEGSEHLWVWTRPAWMNTITGLNPKLFGTRSNEAKDAAWIAKMPAGKNAIRMAFQYKDSMRLVRMLNEGIKTNDEARARLEYPMRGIMHNKFAVMKDGDKYSVWSGTTNVADTCMGSENNANVAVLIHHTEVAKTFLAEFKEMFEFDPKNVKLSDRVPTLLTGRFHSEKTVNTKRYFKFADGHEMRVHFSPTDDGEHRAILPMIRSSQPGDTLRISMFGSGGIEGVRALQSAVARGVNVLIVLDNLTGSGNFSWIKHSEGNLMETNPYLTENSVPGDLEIHLNNWDGLNHHKTATLTKANGNVEGMIIGSQNWSRAGNDTNDENMITIRRLGGSIKAGEDFNGVFEQYIRPLSLKIALDEEGKVIKLGKTKEVTIKVDGEGEDDEKDSDESEAESVQPAARAAPEGPEEPAAPSSKQIQAPRQQVPEFPNMN